MLLWGSESMRRKGPGGIALLGHFNSTNFGNESSVQAVLYQLRRFHPGARFPIITDDHEQAAKSADGEAIPADTELCK